METYELGRQLTIDDTDSNPEFREGNIKWETDLMRVYRFEQEPMIHNSTLLQHVGRVDTLTALMVSYLSRAYGEELDGYKITRMARNHDNPEVKTGDIPSPVKAAMTPEKKFAHTQLEREITAQQASEYAPKRYRDLYIHDWEEATAKQTPEAQLVDIADKWDGLCEVINDIRCGNDTPEIIEVLKRYIKIIDRIKKYPIMEKLKDNPLFSFEEPITVEGVENLSKIDLNLLNGENGKVEFWKRVFDPNVPNSYKAWLEWCTHVNAYDLGIFPRYRDMLSQEPLTFDERMNLMSGIPMNAPQSTH